MTTPRLQSTGENWTRPPLTTDTRPLDTVLVLVPAPAGCPLEAACRADDEAGR